VREAWQRQRGAADERGLRALEAAEKARREPVRSGRAAVARQRRAGVTTLECCGERVVLRVCQCERAADVAGRARCGGPPWPPCKLMWSWTVSGAESRPILCGVALWQACACVCHCHGACIARWQLAIWPERQLAFCRLRTSRCMPVVCWGGELSRTASRCPLITPCMARSLHEDEYQLRSSWHEVHECTSCCKPRPKLGSSLDLRCALGCAQS
jgi:hypothetical protein